MMYIKQILYILALSMLLIGCQVQSNNNINKDNNISKDFTPNKEINPNPKMDKEAKPTPKPKPKIDKEIKPEPKTPIDKTPPPNRAITYDIFLIIGQSNTHFGKGFDPNLDYAVPQIKQLGRGGNRDLKILPATGVLDHHSKESNRIGFALSFAKEYLANTTLKDKKILLIPAGRGSTSFIGGNWNKGDSYYEDAVYRANYVLAKYPNSKLKAILWHQGESDYFNYNYEQDLDQFISDIRVDINSTSSNIPFILGGLVSRWIDDGSVQVKQRKRAIQNIIANTVDRIPYTGFANSENPKILKYNKNDELIHFDAHGQRELGKRYFKAYKYALNNDNTPKTPNQIDNIKAIGKSGKITLKWFPPIENHAKISSYKIQYREKGTSTWIDATSNNTKFDIKELKNGATYEIKISAINANGVGKPSKIVTSTPSITYSKCSIHLTFDDIDFSNETSNQSVILKGTGFKIYNGDYDKKYYIAESKTQTNKIKTLAKIRGSYTKMLWFKIKQIDTPKDQHLISSMTGSKHTLMVSSNGKLSAGHNNKWDEVSTSALSIKKDIWYHVALTYSAQDQILKLYLNAQKVAQATTSDVGISDIQIGNLNNTNSGLVGQLSDVRVYLDTSLTSKEIETIYKETFY